MPADASFALGFAHAQDRLWQMEMTRRVGAGRLAEVVGDAALPIDRMIRTLGLHRLAEANLQRLSPEALARSEEPTSELQSPMRISYAVFCLKKKKDTPSYRREPIPTKTIKPH